MPKPPISPLRLAPRLALALALLACGGPAAPPKPALAEGEGAFILRYNRPPALVGHPDLYFEVQGPAGWERVSLESPDEELDLVTPLVAEAERRPDAPVQIEGGFRRETRAYGEHTARVLRLSNIPSAPPVEPSDAAADAGAASPSVPPDAAPARAP